MRVADGSRALRAEHLALAAIAAIVVLVFREPLLGRVLFERDIHLIWQPQVEGFVRAVAGGSLPLWDSSPAFGQPLLGDPGAQVLYPPTWLNLVLRPWTYFTVFVLGHVLGTALAFFALARRRGLSPLAAAAGAAAWAIGGPLLSLLTMHHFASATWCPVVLLAAERALGSHRARDLALLGGAIGLQVLAGSPDMCALSLMTLAVWTLCVHVDWRRPGLLPRVLAGGAAALLLGACLSAGQWVASVELLRKSARASLPDAIRTYWSVHPVSLLGTVLPDIPAGLPLRPETRDVLLEGREPFLFSMYLGLPALALAGAGLAGSGRRRERLALAVGLAATLLIALGRHAPFFELVTTLAPPLRVLRYPVKYVVFAHLAWAGLVALGVETWRHGASRARWRGLVVLPLALATLAAVGICLGLGPAWPSWAAAYLLPEPDLLRATALRVGLHAIPGMILLALACSWSPSRAAFFAPLAALVAVADLGLTHWHPSATAPRSLFTHRPELLQVLQPLSAARVYSYDYDDPERGQKWLGGPAYRLERMPAGWSLGAARALGQQMSLVPQTPGRWGVRQGFDQDYRGLHPRATAELTRLARLVEDRPDALVRLLRVGGVTHVIGLHDVAQGRLPLLARLPGLFDRPLLVLAVPGALPRVRALSGVRVAAGTAAWGALLDPQHDPARSVVLAVGREVAPAAGFAGRAAIVSERSDALAVDVELSANGYLVVADTYDPGWTVRLDGNGAELLRADGAFRAVAVPAGSHRVEMRYRPPLVLAALWTSGAAALALLVSLVLAGRRRRPARPGDGPHGNPSLQA